MASVAASSSTTDKAGKEPAKRKRPAASKKKSTATTVQAGKTTVKSSSSRRTPKSRAKAAPADPEQTTRSKTQRICFNQLCPNRPRPKSKYCSDECGLVIARELVQLRATHRKRVSDVNNAKQLIQQLVDSPSAQSQADSTDLALINQIDDTLSIVDENIKHLLVRQNELVESLQRLINGKTDTEPTSSQALDDESGNTGDQTSDEDADAKRGVESANALMKDTETEIDCLSCGKPQSSKGFLKHIQSCSRTKEERDTFFGSDMNASNSILCGTVFCEKILDKRTATPCDRLFASCQFHSKERRDEREETFQIRFAALPVCGAPSSLFLSGHCELNPTTCPKHAGWHQIRFDELLQEIVKQEQLQKRLTREQEDICLRLSARHARSAQLVTKQSVVS